MSVLTQHAPGEARKTGGIARGIAALADGKLYALQHPYALDGRVSSYPASARGYSVANSYLLTQSDAAMLIDTGFGKDEPVIRAQIESLIAPGLPLSLFPLRLNEFMSINNVATFAGHFNVDQCYTSNPDAALWFDFGTDNSRSIRAASSRLTGLPRIAPPTTTIVSAPKTRSRGRMRQTASAFSRASRSAHSRGNSPEKVEEPPPEPAGGRRSQPEVADGQSSRSAQSAPERTMLPDSPSALPMPALQPSAAPKNAAVELEHAARPGLDRIRAEEPVLAGSLALQHGHGDRGLVRLRQLALEALDEDVDLASAG